MTHGAGSDRQPPPLLAVEEALVPLVVERIDFPYRKLGPRRPPDRAPTLVGAVRAEATALAERLGAPPEEVALGGRSMGGRMCSMAVAEGLRAAALVLIAYPLHPPGRPERLRSQHFVSLDLPCLFVSGTRDAFAMPEELIAATSAIPGPVEHVWVEGARHELRGHDELIGQAVAQWLTGWFPGWHPPG